MEGRSVVIEMCENGIAQQQVCGLPENRRDKRMAGVICQGKQAGERSQPACFTPIARCDAVPVLTAGFAMPAGRPLAKYH